MEQTLNPQWTARMIKADGQIVCLRSGSRAARHALDATPVRCCTLAENSGDLAPALGVMGRDAMRLFPTAAARAREMAVLSAPIPSFVAR
jgi:hypothetical protein